MVLNALPTVALAKEITTLPPTSSKLESNTRVEIEGYSLGQWVQYARKKNQIASAIARRNGELKARISKLESQLNAAPSNSGEDPLGHVDPWLNARLSPCYPSCEADVSTDGEAANLWSGWVPNAAKEMEEVATINSGLDQVHSDCQELCASKDAFAERLSMLEGKVQEMQSPPLQNEAPTVVQDPSEPQSGSGNAFSYLAECGLGDDLGKYDKVINLFINKPCSVDDYKVNLDGLGKYFDGKLNDLVCFLNDNLDIRCKSWNQLKTLISEEIKKDEQWRFSKFTIAEALLRIKDRWPQKDVSKNACLKLTSQNSDDRTRVARLMSPKRPKISRTRASERCKPQALKKNANGKHVAQ